MSHFLAYRIKRPYSYSVPYFGYSRAYEIWDKTGQLVRLLADKPPDENIPINGVETGPRDIEWMTHKPSTLVWVEALDGGDQKDVPSAPVHHAGLPHHVPRRFQTKERSMGLTYFATPGPALATEFNWKKRWRTTWLVNLDNPQAEPKKVFDLSVQDQYNDPGRPVMTSLKTGERVILQDKDSVYLSGSGASPQGDHPFLDRMNLKTLAKDRLYQCQDPAYETFVDFNGASRTEVITSYETKTSPPNYYVLNIRNKKRRALTEFKDPAPQLTAVKKELIKYKRNDGVDLSGTLYLPADYQPGTRFVPGLSSE
jgi:dipeptidyl aminopeptidase/acylaminoacyl peptidase